MPRFKKNWYAYITMQQLSQDNEKVDKITIYNAKKAINEPKRSAVKSWIWKNPARFVFWNRR